MNRPTAKHQPIWLAGLGYFAFYVPYSALTKALTSGLLPGFEGSINGFEILPAVAMGSVVGMLIFVLASGWWRRARQVRIGRFALPWIGRETLAAGAFTAVIIGTTTMNYTFAGISIVLVLLLMRGGVLILSPIVDRLRRRRVAWYSWAGLGLSLAAVAVALADARSYVLTTVAVINLALYLAGYVGRFQIMSGSAKVDDRQVNRRFFIEEHMAATPILALALGAMAMVGTFDSFLALRTGFTTFLASDAAPWAFLVGLLYEGLFIFGSLIYLDRREFTYCVPVNRGASLFAGLVAACGLWVAVGAPPPRLSALAGLAIIGAALLLLGIAPALERRRLRLRTRPEGLAVRTFLFVCGGNTSRSPMAAAICSASLARRLGVPAELLEELGIEVRSAGLTVERPEPATAGAHRALTGIGIAPRPHHSRPLTGELIARSDTIFCMTRGQRQAIVERFPEASDRVRLLGGASEIRDPSKPGNGTFEEAAETIGTAVERRLGELGLKAA